MSKKALIADDSVTMRKMVMMTLEQEGFEVVAAENGVDALEKIGDSKLDVMIVDINMPEMDGITLIKELRAKPVYKATPILVLTTESGDQIKSEGKSAGASGWIVKPFSPDVLINAVKKVCAA